MNNKIAVIGSNSFSGACFTDYLLSTGYDVYGFSRSDEINPVFLPYKKNKNINSFKFIKADLNHDLDKIISSLDEFKPSSVVNFASQSMVAQSWLYPEHWFQTNAVSTIKLHDMLRQCDYLDKYVHISTPEVYGTCSGIIKESTEYNPSTPYAVSRAAADMSLKTFLNNYNFPVVFTRAANVYGAYQQLYRIIPRTILYFLLGKKLQLHGGGHSVRSFIHINDVSVGTLSAAKKGNPGDIFHFSTDVMVSIRELVEKIADLMSVKFEDCVDIVEDRQGKDSAYLLDSTKAKTELAWNADTTLEQGIDETVKWIKDNIDIIKELPFEYIHKA